MEKGIAAITFQHSRYGQITIYIDDVNRLENYINKVKENGVSYADISNSKVYVVGPRSKKDLLRNDIRITNDLKKADYIYVDISKAENTISRLLHRSTLYKKRGISCFNFYSNSSEKERLNYLCYPDIHDKMISGSILLNKPTKILDMVGFNTIFNKIKSKDKKMKLLAQAELLHYDFSQDPMAFSFLLSFARIGTKTPSLKNAMSGGILSISYFKGVNLDNLRTFFDLPKVKKMKMSPLVEEYLKTWISNEKLGPFQLGLTKAKKREKTSWDI